MFLRKFSAAIFVSLASASSAFASSPITAKVVYVGTYGDGRFFVGLDTPISEPSCSTTARFDVPGTHPLIKQWLAIALAAQASGKSVVVATSGCLAGYPAMSQDGNSYFYVQTN